MYSKKLVRLGLLTTLLFGVVIYITIVNKRIDTKENTVAEEMTIKQLDLQQEDLQKSPNRDADSQGEQETQAEENIIDSISEEGTDEEGQDSQEVIEDEEVKAVFSMNNIDDTIKKKIDGISWKQECPVAMADLRYLSIAYYGFDGETHLGEMIVHADVAEDVVAIFEELYEHQYPIEKMRLIDEYDADDDKSMEDNNTSSFCYRKKANGNSISNHGYGLAIDINPIQNPYVYKKLVLPTGSEEYVDRTKSQKGMIQKNDICYQAFINRGWTWGGDWKQSKDYQHFEKKLKN